MFDPITAKLLKDVPELSNLSTKDIPKLLARQYSELAAYRLRGLKPKEEILKGAEKWSLARIADTYELIASLQIEASVRKSSAFVAATAHQILAQISNEKIEHLVHWNVDRDQVDPRVTASLLFLLAEQYADAKDAGLLIKITPNLKQEQFHEITVLSEHIRDLTTGNLSEIYTRSKHRLKPKQSQALSLEDKAFIALIKKLIYGIEMLARKFLVKSYAEETESPEEIFSRIIELSSHTWEARALGLSGKIFTSYAGPRHLASLLLATCEGIKDAALISIPLPVDCNLEFWDKWLTHRSKTCPFIWPNHRVAINKGFHKTGQSAVVVLPTGAGKTTLSSLKIAEVIGCNKNVVFLAPTHALAEQLREDLQEIFPKNLIGDEVSNDFDELLISDIQIKKIEVMTPESCLTMLSFVPEVFTEVGLLVFDECHLLCSHSGKLRRAIDGMLCILAFNRLNPTADFLFLSAMLKNGEEFSDWISRLTGRNCVVVDELWKPSRQARGVLLYEKSALREMLQNAKEEQKRLDREKMKKAKHPREEAKKKLMTLPYAVWGLQHNWLSECETSCIFTKISDNKMPLSCDEDWNLRPNVPQVAVEITTAAAKNNLKTIVFVNRKADTVTIARKVAKNLDSRPSTIESDQERWLALEAELGSLSHSMIQPNSVAVPHNSDMIRLERDIAERMFQCVDGAKVIVATPTLAQGLNLPAEFAIIAGDKRHNSQGRKKRESLEAHEILNAAARAGRAGHLSNGLVLLIPEEIVTFSALGESLSKNAKLKLEVVFPEDDRCVVINDPLQQVLDLIDCGQLEHRDVEYTINRMRDLGGFDKLETDSPLFEMNNSLAAFMAIKNSNEAKFNSQIERLKKIISSTTQVKEEKSIAILASKSGLPPDLLIRLRNRLLTNIPNLPTNIEEWIKWAISWLIEDAAASHLLLGEEERDSINAALGIRKRKDLLLSVFPEILPGIIAWISGAPINEIEKSLGGNPLSAKEISCPRARNLINRVIPRGLSFIMNLISYVVNDLGHQLSIGNIDYEFVENLGTALRKGFDTPDKIKFARKQSYLLSRVQLHEKYRREYNF